MKGLKRGEPHPPKQTTETAVLKDSDRVFSIDDLNRLLAYYKTQFLGKDCDVILVAMNELVAERKAELKGKSS